MQRPLARSSVRLQSLGDRTKSAGFVAQIAVDLPQQHHDFTVTSGSGRRHCVRFIFLMALETTHASVDNALFCSGNAGKGSTSMMKGALRIERIS